MTGQGRVAVVTGASDGIGLQLANQLSNRGFAVIGLGSRPADTVAGHSTLPFEYLRCDLTKPTFAESVEQHLDERGISNVDLLIHNAGIGWYGEIENQPAADQLALLGVNLEAPIRLTHRLAERLFAAHGTVVFIGSVVMRYACPSYAVYAASKAALDGFARSLAVEWRGLAKVRVVHPGAVQTAIHQRSGVPPPLWQNAQWPGPEEVAATILKQITGWRFRRVVGLGNAVAFSLAGKSPALFDWLSARRYSRS